jgi:hypothetical protein
LECESTPCLNGGKCIEVSFGSGVGSGLDTTESAYTCYCEPGYTGENCETSKYSSCISLSNCVLKYVTNVYNFSS